VSLIRRHRDLRRRKPACRSSGGTGSVRATGNTTEACASSLGGLTRAQFTTARRQSGGNGKSGHRQGVGIDRRQPRAEGSKRRRAMVFFPWSSRSGRARERPPHAGRNAHPGTLRCNSLAPYRLKCTESPRLGSGCTSSTVRSQGRRARNARTASTRTARRCRRHPPQTIPASSRAPPPSRPILCPRTRTRTRLSRWR